MHGLYTVLLLLMSNIFMTLAWYGHLKLQETGVSSHWPLIGVILFASPFLNIAARCLPTA